MKKIKILLLSFFCFNLSIVRAQWSLSGNTVSSGNVLGSTNSADVIFIRNSIQSGLIGATNTSFGMYAINPSSSGSTNSAFGAFGLYSNTSGSSNNAFGIYSLYSNSSGASNTGVGYASLALNSTASYNTGVGASTLYYNTTGASNTAVGYWAAINTNGGSDNSAIGVTALRYNVGGSRNTAVGRESIYNNTSGSYNVGIGYQALNGNTTGSYNVAIGSNALPNNDTSSGQLSIQNIIYGLNNTGTGTTVSTGNIGIGITAPNNSALLDLTSTSRGLLAPRLTTTQMNAVSSPATGLFLYNSSNNQFEYYNGSSWIALVNNTTGWNLSGDSISASSQFLGTTDNRSLHIRTNNTERLVVDSLGNMGIGTTTPSAQLEVNGNIHADNKILIGSIDTSKVDSFALAVNGTAIFTKAKVKSYGIWPDYVFNNNYDLLPLNELENYINENKHLPGIPSADNIKRDGIDLGDNQAILLKKIEELTLYAIDQNKKIEELENQNKHLQELQKQVDELKELIESKNK